MYLGDMLSKLLDVVPLHHRDFPSFLRDHNTATRDLSPIDRALFGGASADRLGYAFIAGYHGALAALVPDPGARPALCVTGTHPQGPVHPRRITTTWRDGKVAGTKRFVTGGTHADRLWVLASAGWDGDINQLVLVPVAADAPGVTIEPLGPTPFAPEVPHAAVIFDGAPAAGPALPSAWSDYVVPFRTMEDLHVLGAAAAYRLRAAQRAAPAPPEAMEELLAVLFAIRALAEAPPKDPFSHRAFAGIEVLLHRALSTLPLPPEEAERWARDQPLLTVARTARETRLTKARQTLTRDSPAPS